MALAPKTYETGKLYEMNISELLPDTSQPRRYFDEQALNELKASIEKHGVLQPVLVRPGENGGFLLVSGERRYQASILAGLTTIPALLTEGDPVEISIVENLLREDLTAIEEAEAIELLKTSHNYQLSDLSVVLGKALSTLSEILSLNNLPATVKDDCRNDPRAARGILAEIAKQHTESKMSALYERYKASGLTRGEIRASKPKLKEAPAEVDFSFIVKCTDRLGKVNVGKLDSSQRDVLAVDLDLLILAVSQKIVDVKTLPQTPPQPS